MLYFRKRLLGLACVALFGCAAGLGDEDALGDFAADQGNVFNGLDAGAALPPVATGDAAVLGAPTWSIPTPPAASSMSTTSSVPASVSTAPSSTPAASTPPTSTPATSTSTTPSTSTPPASSTIGDAGSATRDAGSSTTPTAPAPSASMCSPLKCNINCALLPRCCNEQNECMCLSLIRGCVLPGL